MLRIVFVNLHGNEMLVKTMNKFVFKQSVAIKHKYLLDYLLFHPDEYEVCSYINKRGFSMASSLPEPIMKFLNFFRFIEHRIVLRKNGIPITAIHVLRRREDIQQDDMVLLYRHCQSQFYDAKDIDAFKAVSMIHFWGSREESEMLKNAGINVIFSESDLRKHSEIFNKYYGWYKGEFIVHPFVPGFRFKNLKPFSERSNKAFATGTITYKRTPDFVAVYGDPCDQPIRLALKQNAERLKDIVYCTCSDYSEGKDTVKICGNSRLARFYKALHYKLFESQQKSYYSFDMVEQFNNHKMCVVGEEILGVPGIGFVEGMACGCAYIGHKNGIYEDYGMIDGIHYIGYDGTLEDLKAKITYCQRPEHQEELERIAETGCGYIQNNFCGDRVAELLLKSLINCKGIK